MIVKTLSLALFFTLSALADGGGSSEPYEGMPAFRARTAAECGAVDIRSQMNPKLRQHFHRANNQGNHGYCFAIATADVIAYWVGKPVSGFYQYVHYTNNLTALDRSWRWLSSLVVDEHRIVYDGGMLRDSIEEALDPSKWGLCEDRAARTTLTDQELGRAGVDRMGLMRSMNKAIEAREQRDLARRHLEEGATLKFLPGISMDDALDAVANAAHWRATSVYAPLAEKSCRNAMIPQPKGLTIYTRSKQNASLLDEIDEQLSSPRPNIIGIMYDPGYVKEGMRPNPVKDVIGVHVSTIIGRRFNEAKNRCEYLVRDSFGDSCAQYKSSVECSCLPGTGKGRSCRTDSGIWVEDRVVYDMTASLSYLLPAKE